MTHAQKYVMALAALLAATWMAYWPGLTGPFLFDDFPNLESLANHEVLSLEGAKQFVFGNDSGPGGRPLSMATFLLDGNTWPTDPGPFKRTNLLLHLLSGLAALMLARQLLRAGGVREPTADWVALTATALWLLHPMQTATVFLVVQRMTILCTLFTLLSLGALMAARHRWLAGQQGRACAWLLAVAPLAALGALSKETIAVLPLLAAVIERTVAPLPDTLAGRLIRWFGLWLPSIGVLFYLFTLAELTQYIPWRGFSPLDRFITQGPVLWDYLGMIFMPDIRSSLFHDTYPVKGFTQLGLQALLPWLLIFTALLAAWSIRSRQPWLRFGVLFFFAGHALEASSVPLELFFLHRNYLPLWGLLLGLVVASWAGLQALPKGRSLMLALTASVTAALLAITWLSARYWGNAGLLFNVWVAENPASIRARLTAANFWSDMEDDPRALKELQELLQLNPRVLTADIGSYYMECRTESENPAHWQAIEQKVRANHYHYDSAALPSLVILIKQIRQGRCTQLDVPQVLGVMDALTETPVFASKGNNLIYSQLSIEFAALGRYPEALGAVEHSLAIRPDEKMWRYAAGLRELLGDKHGALEALQQALANDPRRGMGKWFIDDTARRAELAQWIEKLRGELEQPAPLATP